MKTAIMYGAGNIGRGFIGQLLHNNGYHIIFVDVNEKVVQALNERRAYPLRIIGMNDYSDHLIQNVEAIDGRDVEKAENAIASADLMATAVGANILPHIAPVISAGLAKRYEASGSPMDILVCENLKDAGAVFRAMIRKHLREETAAWFAENVGLVETSIGRMVPIQTAELLDGDPLRICVEAYSSLPVDKDAFRAGIPDIREIVPYSPFSFYVERKLYIHNMGHALTAYCGDHQGCTYIWEAIEVPEIYSIVYRAMTASADALARRYSINSEELCAHVDDLITRFANRQLGDTVYRVGRDLRRKLAPNDRMIGALRLCLEFGSDYTGIALGIALALRFSHEKTTTTASLTLRDICKIGNDEPIYPIILSLYEQARKKVKLDDILGGTLMQL